MSGWSNALALADYLASKLVDLEEWPQLATEWHLQSPLTVSINGGSKLRLRGRIEVEPLIYKLLVASGVVDPEPMRRDIAARAFSTIIRNGSGTFSGNGSAAR